jgi:1-acyl-sn-glycerol-3-phosphate acyltransferase
VIPPAWLLFAWRFEGLEHIPEHGPALIACNHASYLDPLVNAYAVVRAGRRPRFLAKDDLFRAFGIGWAMRGTRQIPVARGTGDRACATPRPRSARTRRCRCIGGDRHAPGGRAADGGQDGRRAARARGGVPIVRW